MTPAGGPGFPDGGVVVDHQGKRQAVLAGLGQYAVGVCYLPTDAERRTELEQMIKTGKTVWDVMQVESRTLQLGCEAGLFEKLDHGRIGKNSDFIPGAISDCGVGIFAWSMALGSKNI